ncbi:autotransporter secretion outer membrane protein TamA [Polaromonas sp. OV174]|uniref:autotransporter assembly complex protein TamA n=1 Tax=Polaromonas sp. OV174 TaxID=1855300 RepID=UPI0008EC6239|nr:BamA/TamA family outer membrane protein [Polaromonas sp. OV174]SFC02963.1 autotransporter secretion outer membrane protein TamA [Polaromonas sp. OV174]
MTHPSIYCTWTATAGHVLARFAGRSRIVPALLALSAMALMPAARAQSATPAVTDGMVSTPPSSVTQTAPAPTPPPESVAPVATPQGSVGPGNAEPEVSAFDISVRAPTALRELLEKHLELQRYRAVTDLDEAELARLIVLAERDVRNLVGTQGYFSPDIRITHETGPNQRPTIVVAVDPGAATRIGPVAINFEGDIADSADPDAVAQRNDIRKDWRLASGQRFTQDAWDSAKTQALRELVARRYPAGKLADSLADVDAPEQTASLSLKLDSGPLYRLGPMQITGVQRYDPVLVSRLARLNVGAVYDQNQLMQAQQRLASSGYFNSAYIFVDPESDPQAAPVQVQVREARLQKIILGVGATTDSGPRASVEHTHHRVPGTDWRAVTKLQLEKKSPFAQTEWTSMPDEASWRWVALGRTERIDDDQLITRDQRLRFGRTQSGERIDRNIYLQYDRASVQGAGLLGNTAADTGDGSAITANYVWTGRYFDSVPFPSQGYGLGFELGGGTTLSDKRQPFTRLVGRWLGIQTLGRGRIAMRAEGGAVLANDSARIPSAQLFRTGGDSTVRGYGYRDIGIPLANGVIGPGHYLAVGSVEWQRPMMVDGRPSEWENTFFLDAGAVAEKPQDMRPSVGIGTGVRWKSPIGPLQIDLAYGVKVKRLRLHVSVGFVF